MADDDILAAIDGALEEWQKSPDAMRWSPEPEQVVERRLGDVGPANPLGLRPGDRVTVLMGDVEMSGVVELTPIIGERLVRLTISDWVEGPGVRRAVDGGPDGG